jgi:hypothetical protein
MIKMKVSPGKHIAWLRTFGHVHKDTVKLIEYQTALIEKLSEKTHLPSIAAIAEAKNFLKDYNSD